MALLLATVVNQVRHANDTKTLGNSPLKEPTEPLDTSSEAAPTAAIASRLTGRTAAFLFHTVGVGNVSTVLSVGRTDLSAPPFLATLLSEIAEDAAADAQADLDNGSWTGSGRDAGDYLIESGGVTGSPVEPDRLLDATALSTALALEVVIGEPRLAAPSRTNPLASQAALGLLPAELTSRAPVSPGFRAVLSEPAALTVLGVGLLALGSRLRRARRARSTRG